MTQFLVIPRDTPGQFDHLSPDDMQQLIGSYGAWSQRLAEKGQMVLGHKLVDGTGRVARGTDDGMSVTDGPFTEAKEVIGGFWLIEAADLDGAVEAISDCPHLENGSLEVREIQVMA